MASLIITALCGLKDALNPCMFTTVAFLLCLMLALKNKGYDVRWYAALFISAYFVSVLCFSLGALMPVLFSDAFFLVAGKFYLVAGVALCVLGAVHLRSWWLIRRNRQVPIATLADLEAENGRKHPLILIGVVASAFVLSAFHTIWPMDRYVAFYANFFMIPGKGVETYITLFVYHLFLMMPLTGIFVFASSRYFFDATQKYPSMVMIVRSALSFAIGTGLIYIFL